KSASNLLHNLLENILCTKSPAFYVKKML
ncbi:uncharacterized protein METZ01_LOCUS339897, partial [marine metagenome]